VWEGEDAESAAGSGKSEDASARGKGVPVRVLAWPGLRAGGRGEGSGVDVLVPDVGRARRIRERGLNELAWRLAWVGTKRVGGRKLLLQRCCEFWPFFLACFFSWGVVANGV
jgi:hypothetical protein